MEKDLNFNIYRYLPKGSKHFAPMLLAAVIFLLSSCSVRSNSVRTGPSGYRFALQPNSQFEIYSLKTPQLSASDKIAISFGDSTENCYLSNLVNADSDSELSFICVDSSGVQNRAAQAPGVSGKKSFLWIGRAKHPTHLWVNRTLYSCQSNPTRLVLECGSALQVRNLGNLSN